MAPHRSGSSPQPCESSSGVSDLTNDGGGNLPVLVPTSRSQRRRRARQTPACPPRGALPGQQFK